MNAIQRIEIRGWATYLTRRALAVGLVGIVMVGAGAILAGALLWTGIVEIPTAQNAPQWAIEAASGESYPAAQIDAYSPAQLTAQDGLGEAIEADNVESYQSDAPPAYNGRLATDTAIGYASADEAAGNCAPGETVIKNFRGGYSCNIER